MLISEAIVELQKLLTEVGDLPLCFDSHYDLTHIERFENREEWVSIGHKKKWTTPAYVYVTGEMSLGRIEEDIQPEIKGKVRKFPSRLSELEEST